MEIIRKDASTAGRMAHSTDMPAPCASFDKETQYSGEGIYPEEEEMTNALWLVELMIRKTRL
jgi:hypothetical protein